MQEIGLSCFILSDDGFEIKSKYYRLNRFLFLTRVLSLQDVLFLRNISTELHTEQDADFVSYFARKQILSYECLKLCCTYKLIRLLLFKNLRFRIMKFKFHSKFSDPRFEIRVNRRNLTKGE